MTIERELAGALAMLRISFDGAAIYRFTVSFLWLYEVKNVMDECHKRSELGGLRYNYK